MDIFIKCLKVLKLGASFLVDNGQLKRLIREMTEPGIEELKKVFGSYMDEITILILLEDSEMEKLSIPQNKWGLIRNNIVEFIQYIDIDKIASMCGYKEAELGKILAEEYRKVYEQESEADYPFYCRALYSMSKKIIKKIKSDNNFEVNILIDCYESLATIQHQQEKNEKWEIEIIKILRKFETRIECPFEHIINCLPEKRSSNSPMHYLYEKIDIYGRGEELELLQDFIDSADKIKFWAILGPGGIGKSKLAYSFIQRNKSNQEWKMVFISSRKLKEILRLTDWNYPKNLLLVIDYAGAIAEDLGEWIQALIERSEYRRYKIRLLLLERQEFKKMKDKNSDAEEYVAPNWYRRMCRPCSEGIFADRESIQEYQYRIDKYPCMLSLKSLSYQAYYVIMDDYANAIGKSPLCDKDKQEIITFVEGELLNGTEYSLEVTPLYVLFVTDAALNEKAFREWNIQQLMKYVFERDFFIWEKGIEEELLGALIEMLIYATVVKEWKIGSKVFSQLDESVSIINKYRRRSICDPAYEWIHILTGKICDMKKTPIMSALEPDLVGEYFVLNRLGLRSEEEIIWWMKGLLENPFECREFFLRCIQDYGKAFGDVLLVILSSMNIVLSENCESNKLENQIQAVAALWSQYCQCVLPICSTEPRDRIKEFCESWMMVSQDAAELYTIVFIKIEEIKGQQKKSKFTILKLLYEKWPDSRLIAKAYIRLLAQLIDTCYGSGSLIKGNDYVKLLQTAIDKWGTSDEEVANSCANALADILPLQYVSGSIDEANHNIDVLGELLNSWENERFALYFIVAQGNIATTQGAIGKIDECEQTLKLLCKTAKLWGTKSERIAWRTIDTIKKVCIRLYNKLNEDVRKLLLVTLEEIVNSSVEISKGVVWHCTMALDRIAEIENILINESEYVYLLQRKCHQILKWKRESD